MTLRQTAFTGNAPLLKGALHCHTTRSDGKGAPEDVIRLHKAHGYDFMALTDHRNYNFRNFAQDVDMTIIPGMEYDMQLPEHAGFRCFHVVSIGPATGNGFSQDQTFRSGNVVDQFEAQKYLDYLHANNNMTFYCHPEWSGTPARYFDRMRGNFAMEIWNSGCVIENDMDANAAYWDDLLYQGNRLFGVATDDGHAMDHHCNGWVRVNGENNVDAILRALRDGAFYSSCGPEITDFAIEDGVARVRCSACRQIRFISMCHPSHVARGDGLTEAAFDFRQNADTFRYLRVEVMDGEGRRAWTNPLFLQDAPAL